MTRSKPAQRKALRQHTGRVQVTCRIDPNTNTAMYEPVTVIRYLEDENAARVCR